MENLTEFLVPTRLNWEDVLVDPNNPRFAGETSRETTDPEDDIDKASVQQRTYSLLLEKFDVSDLRKSIMKVGFLPIDRIVVRPLKVRGRKKKKYVVVEGNRRMAAIHSLLTEALEGHLDLPDHVYRSIEEFDALCLRDDVDYKFAQQLIQGIRHIAGAKEWKPYQQSLLVKTLKQKGMSPTDIAETIGGGLSTRAVNQLDKAREAFEQMRRDRDFRDQADISLFSFFVEALGRPNIRDKWLKCSDDGTITEATNRELFYQWITEDIESKGRRKLVDAKDMRKLEKILVQDKDLFNEFVTNREMTIDEAYARIVSLGDWTNAIKHAISALGRIPADELDQMPEQKMKLLERLKDKLQKTFERLG